MKYKFWVLGTLGLLAVVSAALKEVWGGFSYIALAFLCAFCIYLGAVFIYQYLVDYKWHFDEDFAYYKAETINTSALSEEEFEQNREIFIKKYKNSIAREKIIDIFKILVCFSIAITGIVLICTNVF